VIDRWDEMLFRRDANHHSPALDAVLPRLTAAADHSLLWLGASALAGASGNKTAIRAANQVAKRVAPRRRPDFAVRR
jgi:undecaprenyl-diphosphatase